MAHGLMIHGNNGRVLIDGNRPNYVEVASGNLSFNTSGDLNNYKGTVSAGSSYAESVVVFKPPVGVWLCYWGREVYSLPAAGKPAPLPYKVFASAKRVAPSNDPYGLRVWNAAKELVFDSGKRTFNVVGNEIFISQATETPHHAFSWPNGKWLSPSTGGIRGLMQIGNAGVFIATYIRNNGDGTYSQKLGQFSPGPFPSDGSIWSNGSHSVMKVEIT